MIPLGSFTSKSSDTIERTLTLSVLFNTSSVILCPATAVLIFSPTVVVRNVNSKRADSPTLSVLV